MSGPVVIMVVGCDPAVAEQLAQDVHAVLGDRVETKVVDDVDEAVSTGRQITSAGGVVPLVFLDADAGDERGAAGAVALHHDPTLGSTRVVLMTRTVSLRGVDDALTIGAVHGMITRPWTIQGLRPLLAAHLATHLVEHDPDRLDVFVDLIDHDARQEARRRADRQRSRHGAEPDQVHPLLDHTVRPAELEARLVELIDQALGHPPRIRVAPGTVLIDEGDDVGGIYVLLDGVVRLSSSTPTGERILHERSTGPIIGVLSLASHQHAMLRCQAVTDVRAIPITLDQLSRALAAEPELSGVLLRVLLTSLARRLRRSDELQVELDQSLAALSEARAQLVATARFTAVGEMAAGMAHELNNPAAALRRGIEHLVDDVLTLVDDGSVSEVVQHQMSAPAISTAEHRARRRELTAVLGDRELADRVLAIGLTDPDEARELVRRSSGTGPASLERLEASARLGQTLRSVTGAAEGIVELVASLRAYLRGDDAEGPLVPDVDVAGGVDDALRLVSHRLDEVTVERRYSPAPTITARPGALQQVWTNLITNAVDAMEDHGTLEVMVGPGRHGGVRVEVIDHGPGIAPGLLPRIFEPRFTTKGGTVRFGMGLGLSISRRIVDQHGGSIDVDSRPGHTSFVVELPPEPPQITGGPDDPTGVPRE